MSRKQVKTFSILYCGDDSLKQAAMYLYGVLDYLGFEITYLPSRRQLQSKDLKRNYSLIIISDYPSKMISKEAQALIPSVVAEGTGFLMIGGWGSFHGYDGHYDETKIANILPVEIFTSDDRANVVQGAVMVAKKNRAEFENLKFKQSPVIGGYNKVRVKKGGELVLVTRAIEIDFPKIKLVNQEYPLLVIGEHGKGKVACFMTDLAPHWAGGLVDWGKEKIKIKNAAGHFMEVGNYYVCFIKNLIRSVINK